MSKRNKSIKKEKERQKKEFIRQQKELAEERALRQEKIRKVFTIVVCAILVIGLMLPVTALSFIGA